MRSCRRGNKNGFGTAVPHAVLGIRIVLHRRRKVARRPFIAAGLRVAGRDELDAGLLEGEDAGADGAQAAEADQGDLEATLGGHLVGCV